MKKCSRCKIIKPLTDFNYKNKDQLLFQRACRSCTREQIRKHYLANKEYYLTKARSRNKTHKENIQNFILEYLQHNPCIDCKESDPIVLDFDHQRDKVIEVSELIKSKQSLERIKSEITKCQVRCANCHRRKTAQHFNWYKYNHAPLA
ncbi:hypothetical protein IT412_05030 [Candidatus Peregrinibacteria bacterium]|nr:hypothetical protein [Candidatus Peregrinibacteria bacterium]